MEESIGLYEPNKKSVNLGIIIMTSGVFFLVLLWEKMITTGAFYGNTTVFLLKCGALYAPAVLQGEWYRLLTYQFLHSGIEHLINNMLILYFIGNALERYLGRIKFLILYFCSGILAGIGSIVYNSVCGNTFAVCIGASGAVFGVTGALLYLVLANRGNLQGLTRQQMLLFLGLSIYGGLIRQGVDNAAHVAGLAAGFLLALLLYRRPKGNRKKKEDVSCESIFITGEED